MGFRDRILSSRPFAIALLTGVFIVALMFVAIAVVAGRNAWLNMRLSTLCPDYFSYEYAYVVDEKGRGIDSVSVELRDNSNINKVYRTFTDSNGRFVLFNDFGSFALNRLPFSYFLFVNVGGWSDTVKYTFERYRGCHFRKKDGPDSIVCDLNRRGNLVLRLERATTVVIDTEYAFVPYDEFALSNRVPTGVSAALAIDSLFFTTLPIGPARTAVAVAAIRDYRIMSEKRGILTQGVWYWVDRDNDNDLADEQPLPFSDKSNGSANDCTIRTCRTVDSVRVNNRWYRLELRLRDMHRRQPILRVRRADAITGTVVFTSDLLAPPPPRSVNPEELFDAFETPTPTDTLRYRLLLWDWALRDYADPASVVVAIDRDNDGRFDNREGSSELYEHARGRIVFDRLSFVVDTIAPDGLRIFCSDLRTGPGKPSDAMKGTWANDFNASATCPISLYRECGEHRYVVLYFFAGTAADFMEAPEISTLLALMRDQLGTTRIIGINRKPVGDPYSRELVVNENRGWRGPIVRQFHNHLPQEIVCLDSTATIVYRGRVGIKAIAAIWKHAGINETMAVSLYEQQYADREVRVLYE